jgi:hypothetical protein
MRWECRYSLGEMLYMVVVDSALKAEVRRRYRP